MFETLSRPAPERASGQPWPSRIRAAVPYLLFLGIMLFKQRLALKMLGIAAGPAMMAASLGALLVVTPWVTRASGRWQKVLALVLDLLLTVFLYADILYHRQFGDLVSVASLRFADQLGSVAGSVSALLQVRDLWLWADLPVFGLLALIPQIKPRQLLSTRRAAVLALVGILAISLEAFVDPLLSAKYYGHTGVASRMGLLNYHAFDIGSYVGRLTASMRPTGPAVAEVNDWFGRQRNNPAQLQGVARGKNVIVVQMESVQNFVVGLKVGDQEVTPNLNRLARESLRFTDAYSQTGQGVTSDADLLGNCSLLPTRTGAVYYDYAHNDFRCMPTLLKEHGYTTVAMQGMRADFWNLAAVYPRIGFERFDSLEKFQMDEKVGIGLSDDSFFRQSVAKLKDLKQPYYAFLVTLSSHGPFDFPDMPKTMNLGSLEGTVAGHYLHAVHYTDQALGHFLDQLKAEGILDNAVLAVYGDHAGVFRKDSGMQQLLGIPADHEVALTQMEKRTPLMIRLPGGVNAREMTEPAGEMDIAPTLAGLLDIPTDSVRFMGRNVLSNPGGAVPFFTGSAMTSDRLFWFRDDEPNGICIDRATETRLASGSCADVATDAGERLRVSRLIIERDLVPKLLPPAP